MTTPRSTPGFGADASLQPASRSYRSPSTGSVTATPEGLMAQMSIGPNGCDPYCVCSAGITSEGCPCCGYGDPVPVMQRRVRM